MTNIRRLVTITLGIVALLALPVSSQADRRGDSEHSSDGAGTECVDSGTNDGDSLFADSDQDGLTDDFEADHGLDPSNPDSDGDGIADGDDLLGGTSSGVADSDSDGLTDDFEADHGLDPLNPDSDGDGIADGDDLPGGTSSGVADSDSDGLTDDFEAFHGLDPSNPDSDGDGIADGNDLLDGPSSGVADSDSDGLTDDFETLHGIDPADPDSDGDGIADGDELLDGTFPDVADTDNDGLSDSDDPDPTGHFETEFRGTVESVDSRHDTVVVAGSTVDVHSADFADGADVSDLQPDDFVSIHVDPNSPIGGPLVAMDVSIEDSGAGDNGSGDGVGDGSGDGVGDDPGNTDPDPGSVCTTSSKTKSSIYLAASSGASGTAKAKYSEEDCNGEFEVDLKKLPLGTYDLLIDGTFQGSIDVVPDKKGKAKGEVTFRTQVEKATDLPLDFDPRGALIEVEQSGELLFSGVLPL